MFINSYCENYRGNKREGKEREREKEAERKSVEREGEREGDEGRTGKKTFESRVRIKDVGSQTGCRPASTPTDFL